MVALRFFNHTRAKNAAIPMRDKDGHEHMVCILKYTFVAEEGRTPELCDDGAGAYLVDEYNGADPALASIARPSDVFSYKPGTDVLLIGHAHAPSPRSTHADVTLRMGPIHKTVRAYGTRAWRRGAAGLVPGPARPMSEPVRLIYELAWGGLDLSDPTRPVGEPRNYVGRGVCREPDRLVDAPASQLEAASGRHDEPASFGAIHRHWLPRAAYAGTYDENWQQSKMPLLPDDFDDRFNVAGPPDQWSPHPLRGDEPVEVIGATPEGRWLFSLPRITPGFASWRVDGQRRDHPTHLDTVLLDADRQRVELTFRAAVPLPRKYEMVDRIWMGEKVVLGRSR